MTVRTPKCGLDAQRIEIAATVHWNLTTAMPVEQALHRNEGIMAADGPMVRAA